MKRLRLLYVLVLFSWANTSSLVDVINSKQRTWKAGYNFQESPEEFAKHRLGHLGNHPSGYQITKKAYKVTRTKTPDSFDAREQWPFCKDVIDRIRDQGECGSCWAFAPAEVMSDRLCIQSNGDTKLDFAPQELLTCCSYCGDCDGGYAYYAWEYWRKKGMVSGGDYNSNEGCKPYDEVSAWSKPECQKTCSNSDYNITYSDDLRFGQDPYGFSSGDLSSIYQEIMTNGPVQATFTVYEDFTYYQEGVYSYVTGKEIGAHSVKIIGWGNEGDIPYWLVANSWGTGWGLGGYFKIRRMENMCLIEDNVIAAKACLECDGKPLPGGASRLMFAGLGVLLGGLIFLYI